MRRRFFVDQFTGQSAVIEGDTAHHLGRIWAVFRDRVDFALLEQIPAPTPGIEVTLLLSIVKFDAFEWAIEKATELGVSTIVPLAGARSEKALLAAAHKRAERWKKIVI